MTQEFADNTNPSLFYPPLNNSDNSILDKFKRQNPNENETSYSLEPEDLAQQENTLFQRLPSADVSSYHGPKSHSAHTLVNDKEIINQEQNYFEIMNPSTSVSKSNAGGSVSESPLQVHEHSIESMHDYSPMFANNIPCLLYTSRCV